MPSRKCARKFKTTGHFPRKIFSIERDKDVKPSGKVVKNRMKWRRTIEKRIVWKI